MPQDIEPDTILAVDDDPRILNLIGVTIKFAGLNAETTQDPHEALETYDTNAQKIPVVVTDRDYKLHDINGDRFAELIRQRANTNQPPLNVRIIMVTADSLNSDDEERIKSRGVDVIIYKPFSPRRLQAEIIAGRDQFSIIQSIHP